MLNPKLQKYADRLREMVEEGTRLAAELTTVQHELIIKDTAAWQEWVTKSRNVIECVFHASSAHVQHFDEIAKAGNHARQRVAQALVGIVKAALSDLEGGFVHGLEVAIASEVFDSVLEQAKYLNNHGFKDPAAVLGRTVIEDALKRLARRDGLDDTKKAAIINNDLKAAGIYHQPMWRQVEVWLDIGNKAAHGDFGAYSQDEVAKMLEGIGGFLANHFT